MCVYENLEEYELLKLQELIKQGEGISLEFKECAKALNKDVYETVCAFLNRHGGTLLLGVNDQGMITGIQSAAVDQIKKDFITAMNNPQKIDPPTYLSVEELQAEEKTVLRIYVPESSQVHRCNGRIFDRNEDGDLDITRQTRQVENLYHRKQSHYSENKVYPYASLSDLRPDLIEKCRRMAGFNKKDHPWVTMNDMELIKSAQLFQTDHETGKSGVTLAGILLLGQDSVILSAVPHHRTDLILRKINLDRYDDRDFVDTNLIESYERIMAFVAKHLPDPFYLEGDIRINIRDRIFREIASNLLIHRDYMNAFPAKLIIEHGVVRTENSSKPHGFGKMNPDTFTPFPKNPIIAKFFRQIGRADELGSGMRNLMKYGKAYGGSDPELIEGDVFKIVVKTPDFTPLAVSGVESGDKSGVESNQSFHYKERILSLLGQAPLSKSEIARKLGKTRPNRYLNEVIAEFVKSGEICMTIPDKPNSRLQKYQVKKR